jgi:hypothetical protein
MVRTGVTVSDALDKYLRYLQRERQRKPSTLRDYDSMFRNQSARCLAQCSSRTSHQIESRAGQRPSTRTARSPTERE